MLTVGAVVKQMPLTKTLDVAGLILTRVVPIGKLNDVVLGQVVGVVVVVVHIHHIIGVDVTLTASVGIRPCPVVVAAARADSAVFVYAHRAGIVLVHRLLAVLAHRGVLVDCLLGRYALRVAALVVVVAVVQVGHLNQLQLVASNDHIVVTAVKVRRNEVAALQGYVLEQCAVVPTALLGVALVNQPRVQSLIG